MNRRESYRRRIHQSDYFMVRALQRFLGETIAEWVQQGQSVADIGCGEAPLRPAIESRGARYFGFDIQNHKSGDVLAIASIEALPLRANAFDVVLCTEVLEHVADVDRSMHELARVLSPGGIAIVTVPFMYPLHEEPFDFGRPTPYALRKCCRDAGLEVLRLEPIGDEMQAIGNLLDNTWTRIVLPGPAHHVWRGARVLLRFGGNVVFAAMSLLLRRVLPRKAYLGHTLIARKVGGS